MNEIVSPLVFGFTLAISVGPIALLIIQNGIVGGFCASGRSAIGAALGDFFYAVLAFLIGGLIVNILAKYSEEISIFSSTMLLIFGLYLVVTAVLAQTQEEDIASTKLVGLRGTFALTILNPLTVVGFAAFVGQSSHNESLLKLLCMAVAVFIGSLAAQLLFAVGGAQLKRYLSQHYVVTCIKVLSGLGVTGFAIFGILT